jgi:hypothetical protein
MSKMYFTQAKNKYSMISPGSYSSGWKYYSGLEQVFMVPYNITNSFYTCAAVVFGMVRAIKIWK